MFENVVIGRSIVFPDEYLAFNEVDWENNERPKTLFTNTRWLPAVMKEAGIVKSTSEVKKNRPELCISLDKVDFLKIKWGKKFLFIIVGEDPDKTEVL